MREQFVWPNETAGALKTRLRYIWNALRVEKPAVNLTTTGLRYNIVAEYTLT